MDLFKDIDPSSAVNLDELAQTEHLAISPPLNAVRNRAATAALLNDDPAKAVDQYQMMLTEAEAGVSTTLDSQKEQLVNTTRKQDMQGVMSILSDASIPLEQKQAVIKSIQQSQFLKDEKTVLLSNSLTAPSKGENAEQETARISFADSLRQAAEARDTIQGLVNAHAASLDSANVETAGGMLETWFMPFGNTINAFKIATSLAEKTGKPMSFWEKVKTAALPGTAVANIREKLEGLPPKEQVEFAKSLIETIKTKSGIIFSNENQFAQFDKASSIFEQGGYGSVQEFLDNVSPLLDAVGLGQVIRGSTKAPKIVKGTKGAPDVVTPPIAPKTSLPEAVVAAPTSPVIPAGPTAPATPTLLGGTGVRTPIEEPKKKIAALFQRIETNNTVHVENPASPAKIVQQGNPDQARNLHAAVVQSQSDATAEALYGTSRVDAIGSDLMPQFTVVDGDVVSRVPDISRNLRKELDIPKEMLDVMESSGALEFTVEEKAAARANVHNSFREANGLTINDAMSSFSVDGGLIRIDAVYGLPEGSWLKPEDALSQAKFALRFHGIRDDELTLLKKDGLDHVPVNLEDVAGKEGNYLVRIKTSHEIDPTDVGALEHFDVKRNLFDRISPWFKFITDPARWVMDAASMLHPVYTSSASAATDLTAKFDKVILDLAGNYAEGWRKLSAQRKDVINDYIREANHNQIAFNTTDLLARGFTPDEIDVVRNWRRFWDAHYYLENLDVIRTLNANGYQLFDNSVTRLVAKPISKNTTLGGELNAQGTRVVGGTPIFNPATGDVTVLTKQEIDDLYNNGGNLARLRRPTDFNGNVADLMIVRNTPTEYLRGIRDSDEILNYREGYFQLQYTAPRFVDEIVTRADGTTYRKAIAVAGDTEEAKAFADRMRATGRNIAEPRGDDRALLRESDDWWDVNSASGRIAQRHRGLLLEDGSGLNHLGNQNYILNPVESAIRSAKSIAGRTITRPMLEAAKARFMSQYDEVLPSNGIGGKRYPSKLGDIGAKGEPTSKRVSDARTTWQYINYLENGYINATDNFVKATLNTIAQMAGEKGLTKLERTAGKLSEVQGGPVSLAKNGVFQAYIALNPLRQLIVQPHQVVRTWAYNPSGWLAGRTSGLASAYLSDAMGLGKLGVKDADDFIAFMKEGGLLDSVDKQNLVRGTLRDARDSSSRVGSLARSARDLPRKIGFDTGEIGNLLGHGAAVYDRYRALGKNLSDKTVRAEATAEIRALSYDMNFAGDMPYNQTTPAMVLQFMQVPHKAFLQLTNRKLDRATRARMFIGDTLLWGTPALIASELLGGDILPDDPKAREAVIWGFEGMILNHLFSSVLGEESQIDFSGLAPYDVSGWSKFFMEMYDGGWSEVIANSPAGQLFLKDGGRFDTAVSAMSRYFTGFIEENQTPETFLGMLHEIAKISSGYNNADAAYSEWVRASLALSAIRRLDKYGQAVDKSVTTPEIIMKTFGFGTQSTRDLYEVSRKVNKENKAYKEEVLKVYNSAKRYYAEQLGKEASDPATITALTGFIFNTFANDPEARKIIAQQRKLDLMSKDEGLLHQLMKRSGIPDSDSAKDSIRRAPVSEAEKELLMKRLEDIKKSRETLDKLLKETK